MIKENEIKTRHRSYIWTHNNYTPDDIEYLRSEIASKCRYVIWGKELAPTTGTPHLQGFIVFSTLKGYSQVLKLFSGLSKGKLDYLNHVGVDNGCRDYSVKDDQWEEHGERPDTKKRKAEKAGLSNEDRWKRNRRLAEEGRFAEMDDDIYFKFYKTAKAIAADHEVVEPIDWTPGGAPYDIKWQWQLDLMEILASDPDPRAIHWIYEEAGNYGKSAMATYLARNHNSYVVTNGKSADLAYAYKKERIVIFDCARTTDWDKVNYGFIEDIKNGRLFSPKYDSKRIYFPIPHVIIFANQPPAEGKFSQDRIRLWNLCPSPFAPGFNPPQVSVPAPRHDVTDWPSYSDEGIKRLNSEERITYLRKIKK